MGVRACEGCPKCETALATHPDDHRPIADHVPVAEFDRSTGERLVDRCGICDRQLETRTAPVPPAKDPPGPFVDVWDL